MRVRIALAKRVQAGKLAVIFDDKMQVAPGLTAPIPNSLRTFFFYNVHVPTQVGPQLDPIDVFLVAGDDQCFFHGLFFTKNSRQSSSALKYSLKYGSPQSPFQKDSLSLIPLPSFSRLTKGSLARVWWTVANPVTAHQPRRSISFLA